MNIEYMFLQKAVKNRNYIEFLYLQKEYKNIKAIEINSEFIKSKKKEFKIKDIKKLTIKKERF